MSKVTIILEDNERGGVSTEFLFDPPMSVTGPTKAHIMAALAAELWEKRCNLLFDWEDMGMMTTDAIRAYIRARKVLDAETA